MKNSAPCALAQDGERRGERSLTLESQILEAVGHAIVGQDSDRKIIFWNKAAEALFGWRREEVLGRSAREVGSPTLSEQESEDVVALLRRGHSWSGEISFKRRDGSRFEAAVISTPLSNDNGALTGITTSILDITARKKAEVTTRQLATSLAEAQQIAKVGSWEWDIEKGITWWSEQLFEIVGIAKDSAPGYDAFIERVHPDDRQWMEEELRLSIIDKPDIEQEFRLLLPDGTVKMVHARAVFTRDAEDRALRLAGTTQDITNRWRAEEALRASEERFRSLVTVSADVVWHTDATGQVKEAQVSSEFTGTPTDQFTKPDGWTAALYPDDRERAVAVWRKAAETGNPYSCEYRLQRRDGAWRDVISRGVPVRNSDGTIREWIGTCIDVTELKAAQEAIRFQAQLLDSTRESIIATDPAGKIIYMNRFAATQFRVNAEEAIGADIMGVTVPNTSREQAEEIMKTLRRGETWNGEFIAGRRDGSKFPIRASNTPVYNQAGELVAIVGVARDMTEYQEAQRALRRSEKRLRATFDQAPVGICEISFDGAFLRVNPRLCQLYDYAPGELLKLNFRDITHPEDLAVSVQLVGELAAGKRESFSIDKRYVRRDGSVIWALSTVSLLRNREGEPQSMVAIVEDITARKRGEEKLRFQAHMLDSAGEAIIATDPEGFVIYLNHPAESLYGWPREEVLGRNIVHLLLPAEIAERYSTKDLMGELRAGVHTSGEYFLQRRDGSLVKTSISISHVRDPAGDVQALIGICRDVTDINLAREELLQSESRLRALTAHLESSREEERTRIARAIHDELGQLLTGLKMDLRWVEDWLEKSDDLRLRPFLDRIVGSNELTDTIIKAVQGIAAELRPGVLDTLGLRSALKFEARRFHERTRTPCVVRPSSSEMPALSPEVTTGLFRIFQECLTNVARHSGATEVEVVLEWVGNEVRMCVTDNGRGMADIERASLESLGLLGIRERVHLLGGTVVFSSVEECGTTIVVQVPQSAHPHPRPDDREETHTVGA